MQIQRGGRPRGWLRTVGPGSARTHRHVLTEESQDPFHVMSVQDTGRDSMAWTGTTHSTLSLSKDCNVTMWEHMHAAILMCGCLQLLVCHLDEIAPHLHMCHSICSTIITRDKTSLVSSCI